MKRPYISSFKPFFQRKLVCKPETQVQVISLTVVWLQRITNPLTHIPMKTYDDLLKYIANYFKTRGTTATIKLIKELRAFVLGTLSGTPAPLPQVAIHKSSGNPICFGPELGKIQSDDMSYRKILALRILLTILYATRCLHVGKLPNFDHITNPFTGVITYDPQTMTSFWEAVGHKVRGTRDVPKGLWFANYHFSTKNGPNGHALWTSLQDLMALPAPLIDAIGIVGGEKLVRNINLVKKYSGLQGFNPEARAPIYRKITYFPDKEDKVRVIACQDFWSQTALIPLHRFLYRILSRIPQDCTFNQGKLLQNISKSDTKKYSVDLTAATDRFPILMIEALQKAKFPDKYVDAWHTIMVGFPFERTNSTPISYAVGNPMGAYTSWASFALCHHYIIYECCIKAGVKWNTYVYALLGDDIVLTGDVVPELYQQRMKSQGVEVSIAKTHVACDFFEFAKRIFKGPNEISPFPISALGELSGRSYLLTTLIMEQIDRGWPMPPVGETLSLFYTIVFAANAALRKEVYKTGRVISQLSAAVKGSLSGVDFISDFCSQEGIPLDVIVTQADFERILAWASMVSFADARKRFEEGKGSLGDLAISLVIQMTAIDDVTDQIYLPESYPLTHAHGLVSEAWQDLDKQTRQVSQTETNWPRQLKAIALPTDDKVYSERSSHTILRAQNSISMSIKEQIMSFIEMKKMGW